MGLKPIKSSPLKRGLIFGGIVFAFVMIKDSFQHGMLSWPIVLAASVGGIVGGGIYGFISWLRFRN